MRSATRPGPNRENHEARTAGDVRPSTVEQAIRQAHGILAGAGVSLSPSKVSRLCRDYLAAAPSSSFRAYVIRNAVPAVRSMALPPSRGALEWLDPTGDTAVHNVDPRLCTLDVYGGALA